MCGTDICLGIIAIFFPPLAVWVKRGICSADSLINIALCFLGFIPGLLHAWYIISITPEPTYDELAQRDPERGQVTYYYVSHQQGPQYQPQQQQPGYGTLNNNSAPAPARSQPAPKPAASAAPAPPPQRAEAGSSTDGPPSYQQAVEGDHKVQKN